MTREEWKQKYAERIVQRTEGAYNLQDGLMCATQADDAFNDDEDPVEAADEEMTYWTDDGVA